MPELIAGGTIPAFVNPESGSAAAAAEALERHPAFELRLTEPGKLAESLREAVSAGVPRVLVAGGDGTLSAAASILCGTPVALAVLPGGTLNHFARDHGIPAEPEEALALAENGTVGAVDVAYVNDELFLNTSSVGVYTRFVETRDRLESYCGYWLASLLAGLRILSSLRPMRVTLELEGEKRVYQAPLVFVAVGERSLTPPGLGRPVEGGGGTLHVVIPRGRRQARRFARAYARMDRGLPVKTQPLGTDTVRVDRLRLDLGKHTVKVATDGEINRMRVPLEYRIARGALKVVLPEAG